MTTEQIEKTGAIEALKAHRLELLREEALVDARLRELGAGPKRGRPKANGAIGSVMSEAERLGLIEHAKRKGRTWTAAQKREASRRAKARHRKQAK